MWGPRCWGAGRCCRAWDGAHKAAGCLAGAGSAGATRPHKGELQGPRWRPLPCPPAQDSGACSRPDPASPEGRPRPGLPRGGSPGRASALVTAEDPSRARCSGLQHDPQGPSSGPLLIPEHARGPEATCSQVPLLRGPLVLASSARQRQMLDPGLGAARRRSGPGATRRPGNRGGLPLGSRSRVGLRAAGQGRPAAGRLWARATPGDGEWPRCSALCSPRSSQHGTPHRATKSCLVSGSTERAELRRRPWAAEGPARAPGPEVCAGTPGARGRVRRP